MCLADKSSVAEGFEERARRVMAEERGVVGWMFHTCKLLGNRHRFAILLALAELDTSAGDLKDLLGVAQSTVYRYLVDLQRAGLVADHVVGFKRGPQRTFHLTANGRRFLDLFRGLAQENVVAGTGRMASEPRGSRSRHRSGRVQIDRDTFIELLEEVGSYLKWRLLHGLLDSEGYYVEERKLHQVAGEAGIDLAWFQEESTQQDSGERARTRRERRGL